MQCIEKTVKEKKKKSTSSGALSGVTKSMTTPQQNLQLENTKNNSPEVHRAVRVDIFNLVRFVAKAVTPKRIYSVFTQEIGHYNTFST